MLPLLIGGATVSVVVWDLSNGSADAGTLLVILAVTIIAWPIRRRISTALYAREGA